jgi:hypothetical protein
MAQHHTALAATAEHSGRSSHLHLPMLPLFPREHSRPLAHYDYKPLAGFAQRATPAACADRSRRCRQKRFLEEGARVGEERRCTRRRRGGETPRAWNHLAPSSGRPEGSPLPSLPESDEDQTAPAPTDSPLKNFAKFLVPGFLVHSAQYTVYLLHTVEVSQY